MAPPAAMDSASAFCFSCFLLLLFLLPSWKEVEVEREKRGHWSSDASVSSLFLAPSSAPPHLDAEELDHRDLTAEAKPMKESAKNAEETGKEIKTPPRETRCSLDDDALLFSFFVEAFFLSSRLFSRELFSAPLRVADGESQETRLSLKAEERERSKQRCEQSRSREESESMERSGKRKNRRDEKSGRSKKNNRDPKKQKKK